MDSATDSPSSALKLSKNKGKLSNGAPRNCCETSGTNMKEVTTNLSLQSKACERSLAGGIAG